MREERCETIVYETLEEIKEAIAENCDLHDARLVDVILGSDRKDAEFALQLNGYVFVFYFIDLIEYSIVCSDMINLYTSQVITDKTEDGYITDFEGIGMFFKSKKLEMSKRYNGLW